MTFSVRDLSVLAYANGFTLWHYKMGAGAAKDAAAPDFFADASDMMAAGDLVMVSGGGGAAILCVAAAGPGRIVTAPLG